MGALSEPPRSGEVFRTAYTYRVAAHSVERGEADAAGNIGALACDLADVPTSFGMNEQPREKKPYAPPRLVVYGDVRTLTREGGPNTKDGGNNARGNRS